MAYSPGKGMTIATGATTITQVRSLTPPSLAMGVVETTHLTSTSREFLATVKDSGLIRFSIEYSAGEASHATLTTDYAAGTASTWTITFTDSGAATYAVSAFIQSIEFAESEIDDVVIATVTLRCTGAVTITP